MCLISITSYQRSCYFTLCSKLKWNLEFQCGIFIIPSLANWCWVSLYAITYYSITCLIKMQCSRTMHRITEKPLIHFIACSKWFYLHKSRKDRLSSDLSHISHSRSNTSSLLCLRKVYHCKDMPSTTVSRTKKVTSSFPDQMILQEGKLMVRIVSFILDVELKYYKVFFFFFICLLIYSIHTNTYTIYIKFC